MISLLLGAAIGFAFGAGHALALEVLPNVVLFGALSVICVGVAGHRAGWPS